MTLSDILETYAPITLEEMSGIRLMNRTDTKFVATLSQLERLLVMARDSYRVQTIGRSRLADYYTMYFDTPSCDMYRAHLCGRLNRQKLRIRSYVGSDLNFLEVKTKNNHGRTRKVRMPLRGFDPTAPRYDIRFTGKNCAPEGSLDFLHGALRYAADSLVPKIENSFRRITLVNKQKTERLTIDLDLCFHSLVTDHRVDLRHVVIIELKRDSLAVSPIVDMLRTLRIKPMGFSKYCMGMAMTDDTLRQNRFKPRKRRVFRLNAAPVPQPSAAPRHAHATPSNDI